MSQQNKALMFYPFLQKKQKAIAWLLFLLFYFDFVIIARANTLSQNNNTVRHISWVNNGQLKAKVSSGANAYKREFPKMGGQGFLKNEKTNDIKNSISSYNSSKLNIGGPGQPEMATFKSIGSNNMVNSFTGDFSYSIPLLDVGGYPVNLFYNAGVTMEQEASWVGLGWNINPGTINRNMRGLPDDFNGEDRITKEQSVASDLTVGVSLGASMEVIGAPLNLNVNGGVNWNNRRGLALSVGTGVELLSHKNLAKSAYDDKTAKPGASLSANVSLSSADGVSADLGFQVAMKENQDKSQWGGSVGIGYNTMQGLTDLKLSGELKNYNNSSYNLNFLDKNISFARSSYIPSIRMPTTNFNVLMAFKLGVEVYGFTGSGSIQAFLNDNFLERSQKRQSKPAYGFMHYEKANDNEDALMDFNRLNDGVYTSKTPVISIPVYTYDVFNITGEGTGGSFRGYRGNVGYVKDNKTTSKSGKASVSVDIGVSQTVKAGFTLGGAFSKTEVNEWKMNNALKNNIQFNNSKDDYEGFYFKNPSEKAIIDEAFYNSVGADKLIRPFFTEINSPSPTLSGSYEVFNESLKKDGETFVSSTPRKRDKRSQVITYLNAEEADRVSLNKYIWSYKQNEFFPGSCKDLNYKTAIYRFDPNGNKSYPRKRHHISEITVLESDSKRYIYGLPVYTKLQKEVSFSTGKTQAVTDANGLVGYLKSYCANGICISGENSIDNKAKPSPPQWKTEEFFQSQKIENFAHSFLLTEILSPDYVDVKGDGVTDDDLGTSVKFNYSCVNLESGNNEYFKWRYPAADGKAVFNIGLKTDEADNKANYSYGSKELWYLHTIESKNMVATFRISQRNDGLQAAGENGGINKNVCQRKLDRIDLYTKAAFVKKAENPNYVLKPVKTVHFEYDYSLCGNMPTNDGQAIDKYGNLLTEPNSNSNINLKKGKLALKKVWFTYNGSSKKKGVYVFDYAETINGINANPDYQSTESDRWGNYKPGSENLDNQLNADFPYSCQDKEKADIYASAWNLKKILLPSGAVINIDYETDDYSFVQDKRATVVTKILGFGDSETSTPTNELYKIADISSLTQNCATWDNRYVFFELPQPLAYNEVYEKYMAGIKQLLLKLWVKVPKDNRGEGYEPVFVYAAIKRIGLVPDNNTRFFIELEETSKGGSPVMETVIDFMRRALTSKVFPGYDNVTGSGIQQLATALVGMMDNVQKAATGFEFDLKIKGACKEVKLQRSTARLNAPGFTKLGGGHRVKKIMILDNWDEISKLGALKSEKASYYGQEYDYTAVERINNSDVNVSSGVATYEPGVGNDENPFREVIKYNEKQPLGPTRRENVEVPVAETFFPSPMIGYGRVTVKSIHNKSYKNIKSGVGKQVSEFYTTRDFPVISDFTSFDNRSNRPFKPDFISKILQFKKFDALTLTQGVRVVLNDMNGKPKAQYSYPEGDDKTVINSTQYYYRTTKIGENKYKLNNTIPVIQDANGIVKNCLVGKDVEVMNDSREHYTFTYAGQLPINLDFFTVSVVPVILPSLFRMFFKDESLYRSMTTLKVVNEYGILERVVNNDKGSIVSTKNMLYDAETGDVLVSETNNEFNKPLYNFNYPAHWSETGVEPAYKNIDIAYDHVFFRNGKIESTNVNMNFFESGDELYVYDKAPKGPMPVTGCNTITGDNCETLPKNPENRIWAVDVRKDNNNTVREFIFIDRFGNPYHGADVYFRIIRSGKRNLASASLGTVVSQNSPLVIQGDVQKLVIDNNVNVINASAGILKEKWKAQDMFYVQNTNVTTTNIVPIRKIKLYPISNYAVYKKNIINPMWGLPSLTYSHYSNTPTLNQYAYYLREARSGGGGVSYPSSTENRTNTWMLFDFQGIPISAKIASAKLSLLVHNQNYGHCPGTNDQYANHILNKPQSSSYAAGNEIFLNRMKTPWYSSTDQNSWKNLFDDDNSVDVINAGLIPNIGNANVNYNVTLNSGGQVILDRRIEVTTLIKSMLRDIRVNGKNYCYGIRLKPRTNISGMKSQQCFSVLSPNCENSFLEVYYYDCTDTEHNDVGYGIKNCGTTTVNTNACISVFTKQFINPYVQGLLGNWRQWRSYVFYGERRNNDNPATVTNIAKDGVINEFVPFWTYNTTNGKIEPGLSTKWVWNSEIAQYNRKGAQLEDHDALNRYNAAIYGYQETLPVATVSNSRLRESAFDGFEDYGYKDDPCEPYCKPAKVHFKTGIINEMLDPNESHTGNYSYKLDAMQVAKTLSIDMPVSANNTNHDPVIDIDIDKVSFTETTVNINGTGVSVYKANNDCLGGMYPDGTRPALDHYMPNSGVNRSYLFKGKLIVQKSGLYSFKMSRANDYAAIHFDNSSTPLIVREDWQSCWYHGNVWDATKYLNVGQVYNVYVNCMNRRRARKGEAGFTIMWKKPCETNYEIISAPNLYLENATTPTPVVVNSICYKPQQIKTTNSLIDGFDLIPGKKMVVGIWLKKGGQDCKCTNYTGIAINIKDGGQIIGSLVPKSKIIDGWQLFEGDFVVPNNINLLKFEATAENGTLFYLDDLRIHPFNANMKSFVFDPATLRLASELDENNYASFYEYDDEGTLVRVKKETKEGVKTIKETRSAIQSKISSF